MSEITELVSRSWESDPRSLSALNDHARLGQRQYVTGWGNGQLAACGGPSTDAHRLPGLRVIMGLGQPGICLCNQLPMGRARVRW